jgi:aminoglycoside phosphotransferase family enzyme/predicted kinase
MDLKEDLLRTEAYGDLCPRTVELAETHISWVFLLDDDVFKVKKPVAPGFLDFRSMEQRKVACDAEVRLNARLAPEVYKGVVPIRIGGDGRACLGENGTIIDWAVHMARLPAARRADIMLASHNLSEDDIDRIAGRIAAFHGSATADAVTAQFGTPEVVIRNIEENFEQTRAQMGKYLSSDEAGEIELWQTAFVRGHKTLFEQRIASGRVKDGHGDLRLEHVYVPASGDPTIIDCIEFNERFRFGDVCSDTAFLSMDLALHGRVDLAERLLASYARETNDFDLYALVDFYESYRAYVRGKVASMVAADDTQRFDARARAEKEARRYFLLALSADRRSMLMPAVVAVGGIIASGKSTVAERIGQAMSAPVIASDRTRKAMLGVSARHRIHDSAWQGAYDPAVTNEVYAEVLRRADVVLASGRPVVVDASFGSSAMRNAARALATRHSVPFRFVECRAAPSICRARLVERARQPGVSDGRLEVFDAFCARFEPVVEQWCDDVIVLDTARPMEESVAILQDRLDVWPEGLA